MVTTPSPRRRLATIAALALLATAPAATGQDVAKADGIPVGGRAITPEMVGQMLAALERTPGCLGTDSAQTQSGKYVIFAWFEDKQAALAWHDGAVHQKLLETFGMKGSKDDKAMTDVPDDVGPILVVAAASPPRPAADGKPARGFQLGIELYSPLPGGVRFGGGSFAPEGFRDAVKARGEARSTAKPGAAK